MKYIKLVAGIVLGMAVITIVAEGIEFATVKTISGKSFEELRADQSVYFTIRNHTSILVFKIFYSLLAATIGGYLCALVGAALHRVAVFTLMGIQVTSIIWGGFFTTMSATGPRWMWIYLIGVLPLGIWIGLQLYVRRHVVDRES